MTPMSLAKAWLRARQVLLLLLLLLMMTTGKFGCAANDKPVAQPVVATPPSRLADEPFDESASRTLRLLDEKLNTARLAAGKVATMPAVGDPLARREILLHAAMYRAAHESRVTHNTRFFVLDPVDERDPPDIGIDSEEFRLRVLGALDDLGSPVAWVTETWRSQGVDRFPGTGDLATRLRISILERNEETGMVIGAVGDWTAGGGASRQGVTCRWDGLIWQIERGPVRMVW